MEHGDHPHINYPGKVFTGPDGLKGGMKSNPMFKGADRERVTRAMHGIAELIERYEYFIVNVSLAV